MSRHPTMIRIEQCKEVEAEHSESCRQYCHVFHRKGVICVAKAFGNLPKNIQLALLLHEMGHLYAGPRGGEDAANKQVKERSGIRIYYKDTRHGKHLEWIAPREKRRAEAFMGLGSHEEEEAA